MPQITSIPENAVIEYADKGKFQLGFVFSVDSKTSKIRLLNQARRELQLPQKQVLHILAPRAAFSASLPASNIADNLGAIESRAEYLASGIDIEELWELNAEESGPVDLEMLVGLVFESPAPEHRLAMIRALRADRIFFKETAPETYLPRTQDMVEQLRRQARAQAEKERFRQAFAADVARLLAIADPDEREDAMEDRDPALDAAYRLIEGYALFGADFRDRAEAEALLALVQKQINRGFAGTAHLRARALLRETRYWGEDTNVALLRHDIPTVFPDAVCDAARRLYDVPVPTDARADLTHLDVFSIDDPWTHDIDDALSFERLPGGLARLGIHIAAPAFSMPFDGVLEQEARSRATSLYLPESKIPMLPTILSENALSLMAGDRRPALSFMITFDAEMNIVERTLLQSTVISRHRLTYAAAEQLIEFGEDALSDELRGILEITENHAAARHAAGAIDVNIPENKIVFHKDTGLYELVPIDSGMMSRQLVAECMILANAFAADFCAEHDIPALYRTQPAPTSMPSQEELDAMPNDTIRALSQRRCMHPASTSFTPAPHAGLGLARYLQATSPLRRYTDLITHYQLEHFLSCAQPMFDSGRFSEILTMADGPLANARHAAAEANQAAVCAWYQQQRDHLFDAIIVQYNPERPDHPQIMLLDTQTRSTITLRKKLPVGTIIQVRIDHADPEEGALILTFAGEKTSEAQ